MVEMMENKMNMYESRYNNAIRIMNKINNMINKGYHIMTGEGYRVTGVYQNDDEIYYEIVSNIRSSSKYSLFINDLECDEGLYTPIAEYNALFKEWTYFKPSNLKKLRV